MEPTHSAQLNKQRSAASGMLSNIHNIIGIGEKSESLVRFNKLPDIFNNYDIAQSELEISDDTDRTGCRELFENSTANLKLCSVNIYIL